MTPSPLSPISTFLGKIGNRDLGGLSVDEFKRRQRLHRDAEVAAMADGASEHEALVAVVDDDVPRRVAGTQRFDPVMQADGTFGSAGGKNSRAKEPPWKKNRKRDKARHDKPPWRR